MIRALILLLRIRNARTDIRLARAALRHAQDDVDRLPAQIRAWEQHEAALQVELALIPRPQWASIALASSIATAMALVLAYGPSIWWRA